jgi:hypothetical protein
MNFVFLKGDYFNQITNFTIFNNSLNYQKIKCNKNLYRNVIFKRIISNLGLRIYSFIERAKAP